MKQTRMARNTRVRSNRRRLTALVVGFAVVVVAVAAAAYSRSAARERAVANDVAATLSAEEATGAYLALEATSSATTTQAALVEVPDVRGKGLAEAEMVMTLAGFYVERRVDTTAPPDPDRLVTGQHPLPGTKLESGAMIVLLHAAQGSSSAKAQSEPEAEFVVSIDPGHQRRSNMGLEPIGPGSKETKTKVTGGAQGVATRMPEYEFALQLSNRIKTRLEAKGVKVVMTRTKNDVDVSNVERAKVANKAKADLAVRVHADSNVDRSLRGISTLVPASNKWTKPIVKSSADAGARVHEAMIARTGAKDRGVKGRTDLTGFNWSTVPVILVEAGFLSSPAEDELLASPGYQDKLADGITEGIMAYLKG